MSSYHTIFEASISDLPWLMFCLGPVIFAVSYLVTRYSPQDEARLKIVFGLGLVVSTFWTIFFGVFFFQSAKALHDFRTGKSQTIEGKVSDFRPMPEGGHSTESFSVNGVRFAYSNFEFRGPCFDKTAIVGGPIKPGLQIRLNHIDNCILKLEVAGK
jgi:hypothetical protein